MVPALEVFDLSAVCPLASQGSSLLGSVRIFGRITHQPEVGPSGQLTGNAQTTDLTARRARSPVLGDVATARRLLISPKDVWAPEPY